MSLSFSTILGKSVRQLSRLRGGGSALPGLVVEKINPNYLRRSLENLPYGVVVISGTNGKTTTTKIVVELLESSGLKVFTNNTGSNFTRGVIASILKENNLTGQLDADIAVLELDEAHAIHFINQVAPRYSLLLNVMRDQLDRFGEVDYTASLLEKIALKTSEKVVINREDSRLAKISEKLNSEKIAFFGINQKLKNKFPNDDELFNEEVIISTTPVAELMDIKDKKAFFKFPKPEDKKTYSTELKLEGVYNIFNATAALALVKVIIGEKAKNKKLIEGLKNIEPAFGRGETVVLNGMPLEIVLVKNPSGFKLALSSFDSNGYATMIALNDAHADGRDLSWLWDVNFSSLKKNGVQMISGQRGYDMALRLKYDDINYDDINLDIKTALSEFIDKSTNQPKRIFCSYTAMLQIRRELNKLTDLTNSGVR